MALPAPRGHRLRALKGATASYLPAPVRFTRRVPRLGSFDTILTCPVFLPVLVGVKVTSIAQGASQGTMEQSLI